MSAKRRRIFTEEEASMEDIYSDTIKDIKVGQIVKGTIIAIIPKKEVVIDIGYKSEGSVPIEQFPDPSSIKVGDEVEVLLESKEDKNGVVVISKIKAERSQGWERIISKYKEGDVIEGKVSRKVKGGYMVNIGVEAFLPASLVGIRGMANIEKSEQPLSFKIIKINIPRKNIIVSRREVLLREMEENKAGLLDKLDKGQLVSGTVKNITDFGAFIDLGGLDGLLHIADMNWGRISHPSEMVAIGDKIEVMVLNVDKKGMKVSLGLKQKFPNPWLDVDAKHPAGSRVKGKVVNLMPYGAFVELEKGVEGLVHISELSWSKKYNHPSELVAIGDVIEAVVLSVDKENQKIALGIKQLEADPWIDVEKRYPEGNLVKGKVRNLTDYGAFVELEEGIEGFIHNSEMSWTKRVVHPRDCVKKGQKLEAMVLTVDKANRKIALGLKQLTPDPWEEIAKNFTPGEVVSGKVTKIASFGIFVELKKDLEGLVHVSEIALEIGRRLEESYKEGSEIKVRVVKVEPGQRRIALSLKDVK